MRIAWLLVIVALGCGKTAETTAASGGTGAPRPKPAKKGPGRPREVACPAQRAPGNARAEHAGDCTADAQCTAGSNGRCRITGDRVLRNSCTYDLCMRDADCKTGGPCACNEAGNACLAGNCRIDADCGADGSCALSSSMACRGGEPSYYCRTADDTCVDYDDCKDNGACVYLPEVGHWGCKKYPNCPVG